MARSFYILSLILILSVSALFNCACPEAPEPEIDLAKGPEKPPMDLDKPPPEEVGLLERMGYEDKDVRYAAYDELIAMGADAVPILVEGLKHEDAGIRNASASTLGKIGPDAVGAVPALIEALEDKYREVHRTAVEAIGRIGPGASEAIPILIEKLADGDSGSGGQIATALAQLKPDSIPSLIELLESDDDDLILWAIKSLEEIGPDAKDAVGPLVKLLRYRSSDNLYFYSGKALASIGGQYSIQPILDFLEDSSETIETRQTVLGIIKEHFLDYEEAIPVIAGLIDHRDPNLGNKAVDILCHFQGYPDIVVPILIDTLDNPILIHTLDNPTLLTRMHVIDTLGNFGAAAEEALPRLRDLAVADTDEYSGDAAQYAIERIEAALNEE